MRKAFLAALSVAILGLPSWAAPGVTSYQAIDQSDYQHSGYFKVQQASKKADGGDLKDAAELYRKASEELPQSLMTYYSLGETSYNLAEETTDPAERRKFLQEAKWAYHRVANLHPDLTLGYYKLAEITWDLEAYDEAKAIIQEGLEYHPGDLLLNYSLGLTEEKLGNISAAKASYLDVIRIQPKYAPAYNSVALIYQEERNFTEAAKNLRKAIELKPDNPEFKLNLASVLSLDGNLDEAEGLAQQVLKIDPDNALVYLTLGHISGEQKQYEKALLYYNKAAQLDPEYSAVYYYLSITLERLNRADEALAQGMHYVNLSPDGPYAKQANELILTLKQKKD